MAWTLAVRDASGIQRGAPILNTRWEAQSGVSWVTVMVCAMLVAAHSAGAQASSPRDSASPLAGDAVGRMAAGERASYELRLGGRAIGTGSLEVVGAEQIDGHAVLRTRLQVSGQVLFARVDDTFESWIDPVRLFSRRFVQDQKELTSTRYRDYLMSPEKKTFRRADAVSDEAMSSDEPLDDVSFLFYARTLPLRVGDVDTIPRYFKPGHIVILRVLRTERVTVPAGTFQTIVVQPTITNAGGLFGQGGHAELFFSDDATRTLVQLKSKVPIIGSLSLHLREYRRGP